MNLPARSNNPDGDSAPVPLNSRGYAIQRAVPPIPGAGTPVVYADDVPVFVLSNLKDAAGFPFRAVRRHFKLAVAIFVSLAALSALAIALAPKHFLIETKFFAEKNFVMPALSNPRRAVPSEGDSPTRLASEAVMKRTNLLEIVRQTKLMSQWDQLRSPLGKVKDLVMAKVKGPLTDAERLDAMIGVLEKRMWVNANEGTVTIGLDWQDAASGFRIVQAAQQNFFEQRHAAEVSLIGESIGILEGYLVKSQKEIGTAVADINAALPKRAPIVLPRPTISRAGVAGPSAEALTLLGELRGRRQSIADITTSRAQRLTALQTSLTELRTRFGAAHPEVTATEENIKSLSQASPQLAELRAEEETLMKRLTTLGVPDGAIAPPVVQSSYDQSFSSDALAALAVAADKPEEAPEVTFARSRLKIAIGEYEMLLANLQSARIELETARAAFKYRYTVITPARVPRKAVKPNVPVYVVGGLLVAAMAAIFAAIMLDFGGGRVLEPWQVDRQLGLPVLAEVRRR